jgi:hypothetical protein
MRYCSPKQAHPDRSEPLARPIATFLAALLLFSAFACANRVAPRIVPVKPLVPYGDGRVYLEANRELPRIAESLRSMGMTVVDAPQATDLILKARLGKSRGSGSCGSSHNMQWLLWQGTTLVAKMVGRGPIGHCSENIVDAMTAELKWFLESSKPPPAAPAVVPPPAVAPEPRQKLEDDPWAEDG